MAEPARYRLFRLLARFLVGLFYRRIEVIGRERVPATGPLVVAANHQQGLMDGLLLAATLPRRLRPIAKAPLFRYPMIGQLARWAGAIPVHRRQDEGTGRVDNQAMFGAAHRALAEGEALLIFPEGVSQPEPALMPLRTGAARLVLGSGGVSGGRGPRATLLPVGLMFHEPGTFRVGSAVVLMGEPVPTEDFDALPEEEVVRRLLIVEARDRHTLDLVLAAEAIWREEAPEVAADLLARTTWRQRAARANAYLAAFEPARLSALRERLERYVGELEGTGLTDRDLSQGYQLRAVLRYVLRQVLAIGGSTPDHAAPVHVRGRITGIHTPAVRAERHRIAVRIHFLVVEIVVPLRVGP